MGKIYHTTIQTLLGEMLACASDLGLCLLEFNGQKGLERELAQVRRELGEDWIDERNVWLVQTDRELAEYFAGKRKQFDVPLHFVGTAFQQQVWRALQEIDYGATTSYLQQSKQIGNEKAVRAVAAANGQNKISIIVPCHRVIGSNGKLTGYAGGLARKQWLLSWEQGRQNSLFG